MVLLMLAAAAGQAAPLVADRFVPAEAEGQRWWGALGDRLKAQLAELLKTDDDTLLAPYEKRPGVDARAGEAAGRFLEAAAGAYRYQKDQRLRVLMDRVARRLLATQLPDGYLGTYASDQHWTSWDVAVHQSNLRGLIAYSAVANDERALAGAKRIGDVLVATFGPDKRDIAAASAEKGWAGSGIIGGLCLLHGITNDARYLTLARHVASTREAAVEAWINQGHTGDQADVVLPTLNGLVDLYRFTGEERWRLAVLSAQEHLAAQPPAHPLWTEFNWNLLRLTGEPQFATPAAEPPLVTSTIAGRLSGGIAFAWFPEGTLVIPGPTGRPLRWEIARKKTDDGEVLRVTLVEGDGAFPLWLRLPKATSVKVGDRTYAGRAGRFVLVQRQWSTGDILEFKP